MKNVILTFGCILLIFNLSFAQNVKNIDGTLGIGDYKFGASCESLNCKLDEFGWYVIYPNLNIGGIKVFKVKLAFSEGESYYVKGLYWIELYFQTNSKENYQKIVEQLTQKYGTPTMTKDDNNVMSWKGDTVTITSRHDDNGEIVVVYSKKNKVKNTEF